MSGAEEGYDQFGEMVNFRPPATDDGYPDLYRMSSSGSPATASSFSSSSRSTSGFSSSTAQSVSTVPPTRSSLQSSDLVGNRTGRNDISSSRYRLPCEFSDITRCNESFDFDDVDSWFNHIVEHLYSKYPSYTICWFCDDYWFDATAPSEDAQHMFYCRMLHIRDHFGMGKSVEQKRPDFFFLDHLYRNRLIDEKTYNKMKKKGELRPVKDVYPASFRRRQEQSHVQTNSSLRRKERHHR